MTQEKEVEQRAKDLLANLWGLSKRQDRGALAALRRGLSPTTEHYAWPLLIGWGADSTQGSTWSIYRTVAGCYASHPENTSQGNLGNTLRSIVGGKGGLTTFDSRFRRLLACRDVETLSERIPEIVRAAKARGVTVNYYRLFLDMWFWGDPVKRAWAQEFWQ